VAIKNLLVVRPDSPPVLDVPHDHMWVVVSQLRCWPAESGQDGKTAAVMALDEVKTGTALLTPVKAESAVRLTCDTCISARWANVTVEPLTPHLRRLAVLS
jgi:hypothetical protein